MKKHTSDTRLTTRRKTRRYMTVWTALVLAVCLAVPAFAADSYAGTVTYDSRLKVAGSVATTAATTMETNLGQVLQNVGITVAPNETCSVAMMMNLSGDPGTYTFNVPTAGPTDKVILMHWNGGMWEKIAEAIGNTISGYFSSFSPVAIVVIKDNGAPAAAATAAAAAGTGALKAPQTGDSMAIPFVAFAVIALAGVVAVKARKEEL